MLTASDLRWMEEHRRRAALRRLLGADDRTLVGMGVRREEVQEMLSRTEGVDLCASIAGRPALAHRLGCPR